MTTRLRTNEYAYHNPDDPDAVVDPYWRLTSGSLFERIGGLWSGVPDDVEPNASSTNGTNSAIFRAKSKPSFQDCEVRFTFETDGYVSTPSTPAQDWDGLHAWLRYQSEKHLYLVSVDRRDDFVVIKKKVPGGPSNDGTYHTLAQARHRNPNRTPVRVRMRARNARDGSVAVALWIGDRRVIRARDDGVGGEPIRDPGRVGLRGDNCEFAASAWAALAL